MGQGFSQAGWSWSQRNSLFVTVNVIDLPFGKLPSEAVANLKIACSSFSLKGQVAGEKGFIHNCNFLSSN